VTLRNNFFILHPRPPLFVSLFVSLRRSLKAFSKERGFFLHIAVLVFHQISTEWMIFVDFLKHLIEFFFFYHLFPKRYPQKYPQKYPKRCSPRQRDRGAAESRLNTRVGLKLIFHTAVVNDAGEHSIFCRFYRGIFLTMCCFLGFVEHSIFPRVRR
jgi:hypothetical protein